MPNMVNMEEMDYEKISEITLKYGLPEWSLIAFNKDRAYSLFSYFTSPAEIMDFRAILVDMVNTIDHMHSNNNFPVKGNC